MFHTMLGLKGKTEVGEQKDFKPFQRAETLSQKARRLSKESYAKKNDGEFTVNNTYPGRTSSITTRGPNDGSAGTGTGRPRGKLTSC